MHNRVSQLLLDWRAGNPAALDQLLPLVYDELHRVARAHLARERSDHTLQPTALVNEAYLRLVDLRRLDWQSRAHFIAMAATTMRRILVSHARRHRAAKRGGGAVTVTLQEDAAAGADEHSVELIALDEALSALAELDSRQSRVVELRYFAGLSIEETAEALAVSPATVKNEWKMARAWLFNRLAGR
ncbi:MAG: sigma-70 family RNA polymerase sigma factor [Acidobacteria bacterium]|nr:sigma-70 family RNA polymerase sigma factor [Acidobacteriota bacterium]